MWATDSLIYAGSTETVRILLEHGADVNTKDNDGKLHKLISV